MNDGITISRDLMVGLLYGFLLGGGFLAWAWLRVGWNLRGWKEDRDRRKRFPR